MNLGLRYDVTDPIKDSHDLLANYVPTSATGLVQVGQGIGSPYPTNYNNVSPRVGLAWDIFGTGKTVFRSAFGVIFEQPSIRTFMFNGGGLNLNPSGIPYVDGNGVTQQPDRNDHIVSADIHRWHADQLAGAEPDAHGLSSFILGSTLQRGQPVRCVRRGSAPEDALRDELELQRAA